MCSPKNGENGCYPQEWGPKKYAPQEWRVGILPQEWSPKKYVPQNGEHELYPMSPISNAPQEHEARTRLPRNREQE